MSDMNGKVALITGASSGIGRATAEAFAARGAEVVLAACRESELATLTSEIESRGGKASFVVTDVAIAKDVERMVAHAIETFGRLDYAANTAGIEGKFEAITDLSEEDWDRVLDTNLKGDLSVFAARGPGYACKWTRRRDRQRRIDKLFLGFPTGSAYVASKHGQIGLTTSVSAELAPHGIRVNLVCPGIIDTPMHHRARGLLGDDIYDKVVIPRVHVRRAGRPEEIANAIVFLCSDEASYISGTTLTPDGGFTLTV
jgi:NAD(P)-dependent dehydrogenase (short-subunit alcohol dehydrogenase family)